MPLKHPHDPLNRRQFLERLGIGAGATATGGVLLAEPFSRAKALAQSAPGGPTVAELQAQGAFASVLTGDSALISIPARWEVT